MASHSICLIVDDPAPIINPLYYFRRDVNKMDVPRQESGEPMPSTIPLELLEHFVSAAERWGVRGKFSVIPYPAGLGSILEGWEGSSQGELEAWLRIARERIQPVFDITPEILTHTLALDLSTRSLLPISEHEWSQNQDEDTLTPYIAASLDILRCCGFDARGVTSPCDFGKRVEVAYARAVLRAQRQVFGRGLTWYFLHVDTAPKGKQSQRMVRDESGGVVSIVSNCGDHLWKTMEKAETSEEYVRELADEHIHSDGKGGQFAALLDAGSSIVFHTHWQSLYSNGRFTGMRALELVFERVAALWEGKVEWVNCSTMAERIASAP